MLARADPVTTTGEDGERGCAATSSATSTSSSASSSAASPQEEIEPKIAALERARASATARPGSGWARRASSAPTCRRSTAAPAATSSTTRSSWRSSPTLRAHACMTSLHTRHLPAVPRRATAREAQKQKFLCPAIAGEILRRRSRMTEPGDRLRSRQRPDDGDPRRRPLRRERRQDLHLERPDRRSRSSSSRRPTRPPSRPQRHQPAPRRGRHARASCAAASSRSSASAARTRASSSSRTAACPSTNLLGKEGQGFKMLMEKLQQERLCIARRRRSRRAAARSTTRSPT